MGGERRHPCGSARPIRFVLKVRIPGWAHGQPVPGDLYRYVGAPTEPVRIAVNGKAVPVVMDRGFAVIGRVWSQGDRVELQLPVTPRRPWRIRRWRRTGAVSPWSEARSCTASKVSISREDGSSISASRHRRHTERVPEELFGGVTVLRGMAGRLRQGERGAGPRIRRIHRHPVLRLGAPRTGPDDGLACAGDAARPSAAGTDARLPEQGHRFGRRHTGGGQRPLRSRQLRRPRVPLPALVAEKGDDGVGAVRFSRNLIGLDGGSLLVRRTGTGECRLPASWKVLYREGGAWKPVTPQASAPPVKDRFTVLSFAPVTTDALRLEITSREGFAAGIHEWKVR